MRWKRNSAKQKEIYRKLIEEERAEKKNTDQDFLHSVYERYFLIERSYWCSRGFSNTESGKYVERSTGLRTALDDAGRDSRGLEVNPEQAISCYRKAHEADPYHEGALAKVIDYEIDKENWQNALVYCERMITNTGNRAITISFKLGVPWNWDLMRLLPETLQPMSDKAVRKGKPMSFAVPML